MGMRTVARPAANGHEPGRETDASLPDFSLQAAGLCVTARAMHFHLDFSLPNGGAPKEGGIQAAAPHFYISARQVDSL